MNPKITLEKEIADSVKKKLSVSDASIKTVLDFVNDKLKVELKKNYLSHLKSSLEDMINGMYISLLKHHQKDGDTRTTAIIKLAERGNYRPFSIIIREIQNASKYARISFLGEGFLIQGAVIFYYPGIDIKQLRMLIAHELGHVYYKFFHTDKAAGKEEVSNLFGFFAMLDKNEFYKSSIKNLTSANEQSLLGEFITACKIKT